MNVVEHLELLGGVAERRTLVRLTSRRRLWRAIQAGDVLRASRGRCVLPTADVALRRAHEVRGTVSHLSAAAWWQWELKTQPCQPHVIIPRHRRVNGSRTGLHVADLDADDIYHDLVTTPERTLLDCMRTLPFDEALAIADSALRHGVPSSTLRLIGATARGPGAPSVRRVAAHARCEAANPFESVLRARAIEAGLDVVPQRTVRHGSESVTPDLVDAGRRLVLEADSFAWHGHRSALRNDCLRYNWLVRRGWRVLRFAYEDVMFDPTYARDLLLDVRTQRWTQVA